MQYADSLTISVHAGPGLDSPRICLVSDMSIVGSAYVRLPQGTKTERVVDIIYKPNGLENLNPICQSKSHLFLLFIFLYFWYIQ